MNDTEILQRFADTGALLEGHFKLRSGLHSDRFFQAALVLQYTQTAAELCGALAAHFSSAKIDTVISPAVGGIVVGQEIGRHLGTRAVFAEKEGADKLILRRGFHLREGERVLVAEDVITRGGRVQQTIDLVREHGATPVGVAVLVDRSTETPDFGVPVQHLVQLKLATYSPENCPLCQRGVPLHRPGS